MKPARIAVVTVVLAGVGTLALACGGDKKVNYVYLDASTTTQGDGSANRCVPSPVPPFTFKAPGKYLGKCSDAQIQTMLEACVFGANGQPSTPQLCEAAKQNLGDCAACLIGGVTDPVGHPLMQYDPEAAATTSLGVCMTTQTNDPALTECALAFGQIETCAFASCTTPCLDDDSETEFDACVKEAVGTKCTTGLDTLRSDACAPNYEPSATAYGFCISGKLNGQDLTLLQHFTMISQLVCGSPPTDGGTTDAGPDAAK